MPTTDDDELERNVTDLLTIKNLPEPEGVVTPLRVPSTTPNETIARDPKVKAWIIQNAKRCCEYCKELAFIQENERIYLEVHHLRPLAEGGSDRISNTVAVCANCHRKLHYAKNKVPMRMELIKLFPDRLRDEYN